MTKINLFFQHNSDCLRLTHDESMAQKYLFDPLEKFMFGGDPSEISEVHDCIFCIQVP